MGARVRISSWALWALWAQTQKVVSVLSVPSVRVAEKKTRGEPELAEIDEYRRAVGMLHPMRDQNEGTCGERDREES